MRAWLACAAMALSGMRIATQVAPFFLGPFPIISMIQTSFLSAMVKDSPEL